MIRKTVAVLFILVFSLLALPTLFLRSITTTYLDPKFYEGPVLDEAYSYSVRFVSEEIYKDAQVSKYFSSADVKILIEENFTKENVREVIKDFIAQLKAISDKRKTDAIKISLLPVKENIAKMSGMIAGKVLADIPECTEETAIIDTNGQVPNCIPKEIDRNQVKAELENGIEKRITDVVPGELIIDIANEGDSAQMRLFEVLNVIHYAEMILPLFMIIFLLLIMLVVYKPYTRVMGYSGAALISAGTLCLAAVQVIKYLPNMLNPEANNADIINLSTLLVSVFAQKMTVYSLWLLGIGLVVLLLAIFLRKTRHNQLEA